MQSYGRAEKLPATADYVKPPCAGLLAIFGKQRGPAGSEPAGRYNWLAQT